MYIYQHKTNYYGRYRISGIGKDLTGVINHYAFHTVVEGGTTRATKKTKSQAIALLETKGNNAVKMDMELWSSSLEN